MSGKEVQLIGGTHTWAPEEADKIDKIVDIMKKHHFMGLDTARSYGMGASETIIGTKQYQKFFAIDTKAATGVMDGAGRNIVQFAKESLEALKTDKVRTFFIHAPDPTVPVEEQIEAIQTLYKQGRFDKFGLSNFSKDQVLELYNAAKAKNYILPSVYQSSYSAAVRLNETDLFPTLRELGFSIQAYSPMAAGLLAKTPEYIEEGKGSWDPNTMQGQIYRDLYYKPSYLKMLAEFGKLSEKSGLSRSALAYRWVRYHSALKAELGDEMIIGAASAEQLDETVGELEKGPLEDWVAKGIDQLWQLIKDDAPRDNLISVRKVVLGG